MTLCGIYLCGRSNPTPWSLNQTSNPRIIGWRAGYEDEGEWVIDLVNELVNTPNMHNLIPRILVALDKVSSEPKFIFLRSQWRREWGKREGKWGVQSRKQEMGQRRGRPGKVKEWKKKRGKKSGPGICG